MIAFKNDELISSSALTRGFGDYLNRLSSNQLDKIAVLRNNKVEAIVLSLDEYEKLYAHYDKIEHFEIAELVSKRLGKEYTPIKFEDILNEFGMSDEIL
jgi:hypothetical protein